MLTSSKPNMAFERDAPKAARPSTLRYASIMNDEGKPITADQIFKKFLWRHVVSVGEAMEKFTTWTITGTAAIVALLISNIGAVTNIVSSGGIKLAVTLFVVSILCGVVSKQFGMALSTGLKTINELEALLNSEAGKNLMKEMTLETTQLTDDLAAPFWWPLSSIMRRSGRAGAKDYLSADKRLIWMFCVQLYSNFFHILFGAGAMISIAYYLK